MSDEEQVPILYCKEETSLPTIPKHLIKSLEEIETYQNTHLHPEYWYNYSSRVANADLVEWLEQFFECPISVKYQVIRGKLALHVDYTQSDTKLNYIIDDGGDSVYTRWWDDAENPTTMLGQWHQKPETWYRLDIRTAHDVTETERPRISITVLEMTDEYLNGINNDN